MDRLNKIMKNTLIFLVVFLALNYILSSCQNQEEEILESSGNLLFTTSDTEYSRVQTVKVEIENNTASNIVIPNECPSEPFDVYRYENNEWIQKSVTPELECEPTEELIIEPGEDTVIGYDQWNYALFSELGRFKIEFKTQIGEEEKTITSNEFIIVKEGIFKKLWMGLIYKPIYNALIFFTYIIPGHSLGWAIILLTLIIRTILLAPSQKAMKAQKKMQEIQPRLEKIKKKYKGDQQKIAMETMALWKTAKVNPAGSCLPILLQFPFLIALFYVVRSGLNPDNAFLLYTQYEGFTLHNIDVNFLNILDLTKVNSYVLPLIVGGLQFAQMKLSMGRKANKNKSENKENKDKKDKKKNEMEMATGTMVYIMPVMIAVFTATMPAGVGIYWGTSTAYATIQQLFVNRSGGSKDPEEPTVKVIKSKN